MSEARSLVPYVLGALLYDAETIDTMRSTGDQPADGDPLAAAAIDDVEDAVRIAAREGLIEDEPRYLPILDPEPTDEERFRARWWRLTAAGEQVVRDLRLHAGVDLPEWIERAEQRARAALPELEERDLWLTWHEDASSNLIVDVEAGGRLETRVTCMVGDPRDEEELVAFLTTWLREHAPRCV